MCVYDVLMFSESTCFSNSLFASYSIHKYWSHQNATSWQFCISAFSYCVFVYLKKYNRLAVYSELSVSFVLRYDALIMH